MTGFDPSKAFVIECADFETWILRAQNVASEVPCVIRTVNGAAHDCIWFQRVVPIAQIKKIIHHFFDKTPEEELHILARGEQRYVLLSRPN